jgi:hypothetical protein
MKDGPADRIENARSVRSFANVNELARQTRLNRKDLHVFADAYVDCVKDFPLRRVAMSAWTKSDSCIRPTRDAHLLPIKALERPLRDHEWSAPSRPRKSGPRDNIEQLSRCSGNFNAEGVAILFIEAAARNNKLTRKVRKRATEIIAQLVKFSN